MNKMLMVGTGVSGLGHIPILGCKRLNNISQIIKALFAKGEQGFAYDFNDFSTMFQDAAGNIPVTAAGQPVGLVLDKSKGLKHGAELFTKFDSTLSATLSSVNTPCVVTSTVSMGVYGAVANVNFMPGVYKIDFAWEGNVINREMFVTMPDGNNLSLGFATAGTYSKVIRFNSQGGMAIMQSPSAVGQTFTIKQLSIKSLLGNHAYQTVSASRPLLGRHPTGGARNLFSYSNGFSNTVWIKAQSLLTPVNISAPDGTLTATKLIEGTQPTAYHQLYQSYAATDITKPVTFSFYAKAAELTKVNIMVNWNPTGHFDLANGTATGTGRTITPVGDGWYRCSITGFPPDTAVRTYVAQLINGSGQEQYTGNGVSGVYVWGAQLEIGSVATAYQGTLTQLDIVETSKSDCWYIKSDGIDDFLVTNNIDFTMTDKVSLFAGVRKLSDAVQGSVVELGRGVFLETSGSFVVNAPAGAGVAGYKTYVQGGSASTLAAETPATFPAPISNVLTMHADIANKISKLNVNGIDVSATTGAVLNGNFGNYPLYIGRRAGQYIPFTGNIYSLIGISRLTTNSETIAIEKAIAKATGVTLNV